MAFLAQIDLFEIAQEMPWGFDPKDRGKIKETFISAQRANILPNYDDPSVESLQLTDQEVDLYCEMAAEESNAQPLHQVGGFYCNLVVTMI